MPMFMGELIDQIDDLNSLATYVQNRMPIENEDMVCVQSTVPLEDIAPWANKNGLAAIEFTPKGGERVLSFLSEVDLPRFLEVLNTRSDLQLVKTGTTHRYNN